MNLCADRRVFDCAVYRRGYAVTVIQMLWINIIMDTLAGLAFAGEPALAEYMKEKPTRRNEPVLCGNMVRQIVCMGAYTIGLCLVFLKAPAFKRIFDFYENAGRFYTAFFTLFVLAGVFNGFNARTERIDLFSHLKNNKTFVLFSLLVVAVQLLLVYFGGAVFRCAGLTAKELGVTLLLALTVIPVDLIRKVLSKKFRRGRVETRNNGKYLLKSAIARERE